jgi:hypothetical protein
MHARTSAVISVAATMCCLFLIEMQFAPISHAQSCPTVNQWVIGGRPDIGFVNGAQVTIYVVGGLQSGNAKIAAVASKWKAISGSTISFTVVNSDSDPPFIGSTSNPIVIYHYGNPTLFQTGQPCENGDACTDPPQLDANGNVQYSVVEVNPIEPTGDQYFQVEMDHEMAHAGYGLLDCKGCNTQDTITASPVTTTTDSGPTGCDQQYVYQYNGGQYGLNPNPGGGGQCPEDNCELCGDPSCWSPIIIDLDGSNFPLTSLQNGVSFDLDADGSAERTSWTAADSNVAFLALDRNGNGMIDNGAELFGNHTPQPASQFPNGFLALAQYDKPENGGNGNGMIDPGDAIFTSLRLWIDSNHDGISQPSELHSLSEFGITSISLDYRVAYRRDGYGNQFRYRTQVESTDRGVFLWAYDVFFVTNDVGSQTISRSGYDVLEAFWRTPLFSPALARTDIARRNRCYEARASFISRASFIYGESLP